MSVILVILFVASAVAGGFIGARSRHTVDGVFIGLLTGPLGILALWFCRDDNWTKDLA
jgi:hypothetical protein